MVGWRLEGSERKSSRVEGGWRLPQPAMCGGRRDQGGERAGVRGWSNLSVAWVQF